MYEETLHPEPVTLVVISHPDKKWDTQEVWINDESESFHTYGIGGMLLNDDAADAWIAARYPNAEWCWI